MGEAASMVVVVGAESDGKGLSKSGGGGGEVVMSAVVWDRGWVEEWRTTQVVLIMLQVQGLLWTRRMSSKAVGDAT